MRFTFTEDQLVFASTLRDLLSQQFSASQLRKVWDDGTGIDRHLWSQLAEMGVTGVLAPESDGGFGATMVEAVLLCRELGRAGVPGPILETLAVVAPAARDSAWLEGIIDGSVIATTALFEEQLQGGDQRADAVIGHAPVADIVLETTGLRALLNAEVTRVESLDPSRTLGTVAGGTLHPMDVDIPAAWNRGNLAIAAALIGAAEQLIDMTGAYARDRHQFGVPIGTFQAVKHSLANALLKVEFAKAPLYRAAWAYSSGAADVDRDVSMARALANDAAHATTLAAIQIHGAIGYTWEADPQLWMKRIWSLERVFGSTSWHRRRVANSVLV